MTLGVTKKVLTLNTLCATIVTNETEGRETMYSEKIKAIKPATASDRKVQSAESTANIIRNFCTKEDAIYAPCKQLLDLFDQFCNDFGYPLLSRNHVGSVLCKMYGLKRKSARVNGDVTWIYVEK